MELLRIDPRLAPLWRDDRTLQFGIDAALTVTASLPWQERAIAELERGFPSADPAHLAATIDAPVAAVAELLETLRPVLLVSESDSQGVIVRASDRVAPAVVERLISALDDCGLPGVWAAPDQEPIAPETPTILLGAHLVPPHMADRCMREGTPHLPIAFLPGGADVGPLVIPGETACLACLAAHDSDRDAAWPVIATQLLTREPPPVTLPLTVEAAVLATRLLGMHRRTRHEQAVAISGPTVDAAGHRGTATRSVRVTTGGPEDDSTREWRTHRPHRRCLCGGPISAELKAPGSDERRQGDRPAHVA